VPSGVCTTSPTPWCPAPESTETGVGLTRPGLRDNFRPHAQTQVEVERPQPELVLIFALYLGFGA